jgi:hypothetical protein
LQYDRISIKQVNVNTLTDERKKAGGSYHATGRTVVSNGGKTMTVTINGANAAGKAFTSTLILDKQYLRVWLTGPFVLPVRCPGGRRRWRSGWEAGHLGEQPERVWSRDLTQDSLPFLTEPPVAIDATRNLFAVAHDGIVEILGLNDLKPIQNLHLAEVDGLVFTSHGRLTAVCRL